MSGLDAGFGFRKSGGAGGASTFLALTDTPASYAGASLMAVRVNAGETALEFVAFPGHVAITDDIIPRGTGTTVEDGTWTNVANDIIPVTNGSNIGSATKGVGTLFMASTIDYGSNLIFKSTTTKATLTTSGRFGVGVDPLLQSHLIQTETAVGTGGYYVETNTVAGVGFQTAFTFRNNLDGVVYYTLKRHNTGNYPIVSINNTTGTPVWNLSGSAIDNWFTGRMIFGDTSGINNARVQIKGFGTSNALNLNVTNGSGVTGFDVRDDNRVRVNAGQGASGDFEIYGDVNVAFVSADVSTERFGIGVASSSILAKLHVKAPDALSTSKGFLVEDNVGTDVFDVRNNGDIFNMTRIMTTQGRTVVNTATYTILATDRTLGVTRTTAGTCTLTMPLASDFKAGTGITIKDEGDNATTNNITINRTGADTIDGINTQIINVDLDSLVLYSDGVASWFKK